MADDTPEQMKEAMDEYIRWIIGEFEVTTEYVNMDYDTQDVVDAEAKRVRNKLRMEQLQRAGLWEG